MSEALAAESSTRDQLLDATERVLVKHGQAAVTTRRIAEEAGVAHGLIRYHFGSLDDLMRAMLERSCEQILERQRALYASDTPFLEKWRTAMGYWDVDLEAGYPKLLAELMARGWNDPTWQETIGALAGAYEEMLEGAVRAAADEYHLENVDVAAMGTLLRLFQLGVLVDRVSGVDTGHERLNSVIEAWLQALGTQDTPTEGS
jgi:AcrR family transcriptional regulator